MEILKAFGTAFYETLKSGIKFRSISKDDLRDLIRECITTHETFITAMDKFTPQEMNEFKARFAANVKGSSLKSASVYDTYLTKLPSRALSDERTKFMGSLYHVNKTFVSILKDILKNINTLVEKEAINLKDTRVTQIAILGILRQSRVLSRWSINVWIQYLRIGTNTNRDVPGSRVVFLLDNVDLVNKITRDIYNKTGAYMFLADVNSVKQKKADFLLGASDSSTMSQITGMLNPAIFKASFLDNLVTALRLFTSIFQNIGEKWDDWMHAIHLENIETKEWMENHNALLRMELADTDRSDPKYDKLVSIIEAYDQKITDYNAKIRRYEEGE